MDEKQKVIEKIKKCLNLNKGTNFEGEAERAMAAAMKLAAGIGMTIDEIRLDDEECTVLRKDSKTITYADFNSNERIIHKQDCGNVVVLNDKKPIDRENIERIIAEKMVEALKLELKKLDDPYYLALVDEHLKELDIEIQIGFKEDE